jgi:glycosyltransferase involved in cell wall biosynthesis
VIVACFNVAEFVPACLRSIFHQPQVDKLKVLVIDDGSVDNTSEVVQAQIAAHPNVNCELINQSNQGLSGARNTGLHLARTSYVTFVDGDDLWAENYLELVVPVIDEGRADIIAYNASIVDAAGRRLDSLHIHTRFSREARFSCSELASTRPPRVGGTHGLGYTRLDWWTVSASLQADITKTPQFCRACMQKRRTLKRSRRSSMRTDADQGASPVRLLSSTSMICC